MNQPRKAFALSPNCIPFRNRTIAEIEAAGEWPQPPHEKRGPGGDDGEADGSDHGEGK